MPVSGGIAYSIPVVSHLGASLIDFYGAFHFGVSHLGGEGVLRFSPYFSPGSLFWKACPREWESEKSTPPGTVLTCASRVRLIGGEWVPSLILFGKSPAKYKVAEYTPNAEATTNHVGFLVRERVHGCVHACSLLRKLREHQKDVPKPHSRGHGYGEMPLGCSHLLALLKP